MEIEDASSSHASIAFPLGLALLVALLLFFCCFFCFCLHWEKIQSLFLNSSNNSGVVTITNPLPHTQQPDHLIPSHHKSGFPVLMVKQNGGGSYPVLMPGDDVPKFMALACPCHPPINHERITIHVHKPTTPNHENHYFCTAT